MIQDESLNEINKIKPGTVGKIVHHDLEKNGTINYYNIQFENTIVKYVPASLVESIKEQKHEHDSKE